MATSDFQCPVCLQQKANKKDVDSDPNYHGCSGYWINCPACGEFVITDMDYDSLMGERRSWKPSHVSALLREQSISRRPTFWLRGRTKLYGPLKRRDLAIISVEELLTRWPRTVPERVDRALCNLARLSPTAGSQIRRDASDCPLWFAETPAEAQYFIDVLLDHEFLFTRGNVDPMCMLTLKGWSRFDELTRGMNAPENPAFVAMWFGSDNAKTSMTEAFEQGMRPAIEQAGYRATRVDLTEHNDWIMDKVFGDIRLAPFVVADFTGNRNGVYFEAGFARGLGIPVIHTCREEHLDQAHFDTKQLNHVLWKTPEELQKKLYYRIIGTIGQGPHPASQALPSTQP